MTECSTKRRLLVVSDMHMGRDCKEITGFKGLRPNPEFDQAAIDLLNFYTSAREDEWRLIIGGDFIDFMEVVVVPGAQGPLDLALTFDVTDEEKEFGLGSEAERVVIKLEKTFDYHQAFFRRLSQFVKEGGELVMLRGNHDVELFWSKVQRVFRRTLSNLAFLGEHLDVDQAIDLKNAFQSRVTFAPWVYIEPGRIYVEHGHQYDEYCSFDNQLFPVSPSNPRRIDTPLSAFAMRYFVNLMQDFTPSDVDQWDWRDYALWLRKKGFAGTLYTARMAIGVGVRILHYGYRSAFGQLRRYTKEHTKQMAEEAKTYGVPQEKLAAIDGLRHTPVNRNLPELMRLLFLDRILLAFGALALIMMLLVVVDSSWIELVGITMVAALVVRINRQLAPRRFLTPGPKQANTAKRIAEILEIPLVVMGHSHGRREADLGGGRKYINTGCWLPPLSGEEHVDPKQPCSCKLSHLVVEPEGAAELRVFCRATHTVRLTDVREASVAAGAMERESVDLPAAGLVP